MVSTAKAFSLAQIEAGAEILRSGNLDPATVIETHSSESVFDEARVLAQAEQGRPFVLSGGCEITPLTPMENLKAMKKAAQ